MKAIMPRYLPLEAAMALACPASQQPQATHPLKDGNASLSDADMGRSRSAA